MDCVMAPSTLTRALTPVILKKQQQQKTQLKPQLNVDIKEQSPNGYTLQIVDVKILVTTRVGDKIRGRGGERE